MANPRQLHMDAAHRIICYLKSYPGQGLFLSSSSALQLLVFCDFDWAGCLDTRRSITSYCIMLGSSPISWRFKKQTIVSRSSAEAEYRAMAPTCSEIQWMHSLLRDLADPHPQPTLLFCGNRAALHIDANPVFHEWTKPIEIDCHFIRDMLQAGRIQAAHISTKHQPADLFIKALGADQFPYLSRKLGVLDIHTLTWGGVLQFANLLGQQQRVTTICINLLLIFQLFSFLSLGDLFLSL